MSTWSSMSLRDRLAAFMQIEESGCWSYTGFVNRSGYATVMVGGHHTGVHRAMYELARGPIPPDLQIDHLCRNRRCINPYHLDVVTARENCRRGKGSMTHCKRGHLLSGNNVAIGDKGERRCKACHAWRERERRRLRKEAHA